MLTLNNIIVHGHFSNQKSLTEKQELNFFQNNLVIVKKKFTINITKHINFIFYENKLESLLEKVLSEGLQSKVRIVSLKISNIHQSVTLQLNLNQIRNSIIPNLHNDFGIIQVEVSEESNVFTPVSLETLQNNIKNFICFSLKLHRTEANLKFQSSKTKKETHCTLILNNFRTESVKLCKYIDHVAELQNFSQNINSQNVSI